jgi:hypothetical protein
MHPFLNTYLVAVVVVVVVCLSSGLNDKWLGTETDNSCDSDKSPGRQRRRKIDKWLGTETDGFFDSETSQERQHRRKIEKQKKRHHLQRENRRTKRANKISPGDAVVSKEKNQEKKRVCRDTQSTKVQASEQTHSEIQVCLVLLGRLKARRVAGVRIVGCKRRRNRKRLVMSRRLARRLRKRLRRLAKQLATIDSTYTTNLEGEKTDHLSSRFGQLFLNTLSGKTVTLDDVDF